MASQLPLAQLRELTQLFESMDKDLQSLLALPLQLYPHHIWRADVVASVTVVGFEIGIPARPPMT